MSWSCLLMLCLVLCLPRSARSQVVINEIMANNTSTLANQAGLFSDWIELYNTSSAAVDIGGYTLTDNPSFPTQYIFPPGTPILAHGYLLVWCDSSTGVGEYHTGFNLSAKGASVLLYSGFGFALVDSNGFGLQLADLSIGRVPDGTGAWTLNEPTPELANKAKTLGSIFETNGAVVLTNLFINEWLATNSMGPATNRDPDWLELYNKSTNPIALGGVVFSSAWPEPGTVTTNRPIVPLSFIDGSGYIQFNCVGNKAKKNDELDFKLSHTSGETISLYPVAGQTNVWIDRISFPGNNTVSNYWPTDSGLFGVSYGRLPDGGTNIVQFSRSRITPGASNFQSITNVVINEALTHTDPPLEDAIELYNPTTNDVDISYWWLSNRPDNPFKFQIPPGTIITAGGYKVFYEQIGVTTLPHKGFNTSGTGTDPDFTLNSAHGDSVYLFIGNSSGAITGYRRGIDFGSAQHGIAFGRFITSVAVDIVAMSSNTFGMDNPATVAQFRTGTGLTNAYPLVGALVINEIMYHPPDIFNGLTYVDDGLDEYIEVYNITTNTYSLWDTNTLGTLNGLYFDSSVGFYADGRTNTWRLRGMVNYDFPTNVHLGAGQTLLLVNFDPILNPSQSNTFVAKYGVPADVQIFGPYNGGRLKNSGGSVELDKPDPPQPPSHPDFRFVPYIQVDKITFNDKAPWPTGPDGGGAALHRIVPERYGNEPTNWESAFPTPGWEPLHINSSQRTGNSFVLGFRSLAGGSYSVQAKTNLNAPAWTKVTNFTSQSFTSVRSVTNTLSTTNRFYRLVTPAQP